MPLTLSPPPVSVHYLISVRAATEEFVTTLEEHFHVAVFSTSQDVRLKNAGIFYALALTQFERVVLIAPSAVFRENVEELPFLGCPAAATHGERDDLVRGQLVADMCKQPGLVVCAPSRHLWVSANREFENSSTAGSVCEAWRALLEILSEDQITCIPKKYHTTALQFGEGTPPPHGNGAAILLGYRPQRSAAAELWRSAYREATGEACNNESDYDE